MQHNWFQRVTRSAGVIATALTSAAIVATVQFPSLHQLKTNDLKPSVAELKQQVSDEALSLALMNKLPSIGFDNLMADWTFLKFLQYFGDDDARSVTDYSLSPNYFDIILKHDPRFLNAYIFLSGSTSLYAGRPDRTIALMNRGLEVVTPKVPKYSYYIWRYKGTDELLFLGNAKSAKASFQTSARWAKTYTDPESQQVARWSQQTAEFLERNPNSKSAQVSAWSIVLGNVTDKKTRDYAINKIRELGGDVQDTPEGLKVISPQRD